MKRGLIGKFIAVLLALMLLVPSAIGFAEEIPAEEKPAVTEDKKVEKEKPAAAEENTPVEKKPEVTEDKKAKDEKPAATEVADVKAPAEEKPAITETPNVSEGKTEPQTNQDETKPDAKPQTEQPVSENPVDGNADTQTSTEGAVPTESEVPNDEVVEDEEIVEVEPVEEEQTVVRKVTTKSNLGKNIIKGDTFTLTATLEGFEDCSYEIYWEYNDGNGWTQANDSHTLKYDVKATEDTVNYRWRACVEVISE